MKKKSFFIVFFVLNLAIAKNSEPSSGDKVFAKVLPSVFKVKTSPSAESPQASYGTGFVVDTSGILISNYHVVSDSIVEPKKNKIFVVIGDKAVAGKVLAVDVVHDLSLIKVEQSFKQALSFSKEPPRQGEPIFSIGQPEDLNMSIISGTYNDEVKAGPYRLIHLSAPINEGMSGGPTVNSAGDIIGVNVSKLLFANNISFAVPAAFAQDLFHVNRQRKDVPEKFWGDMQSQLLKLQDALAQDILKSLSEKKDFYGWMVPKMPSVLKCWSANGGGHEEKDMYDQNMEICDLQHAAYLSSELQTGTVKLTVKSFENKKLNAWQFYDVFSGGRESTAFSDGGFFIQDQKPSLTAKGECISNVVVTPAGLKYRLGYCARKYTHFPELEQAHVVMTTFGDSKNALSLDLELQGFTEANVMSMVKKMAENVERGNVK